MNDQTTIMLVVSISCLFVFTVYGVTLTWLLYHTPSLETVNNLVQDDINTILSFGNTAPLPPLESEEPGYEHIELVPYTPTPPPPSLANPVSD
jgi:hypothetical protein